MDNFKRFLLDINVQIAYYKAGKATASWFVPQTGLCDNWEMWLKRYHPDQCPKQANKELKALFAKQGYDVICPFNLDMLDYVLESRNRDTWNNQDRLNWINAQL